MPSVSRLSRTLGASNIAVPQSKRFEAAAANVIMWAATILVVPRLRWQRCRKILHGTPANDDPGLGTSSAGWLLRRRWRCPSRCWRIAVLCNHRHSHGREWRPPRTRQGGWVDIVHRNLIGHAALGGMGGQVRLAATVPIDEARRQIETNLFGPARLIQLVLPTMRAQRSGRIVNISSIGGKFAVPLADGITPPSSRWRPIRTRCATKCDLSASTWL